MTKSQTTTETITTGDEPDEPGGIFISYRQCDARGGLRDHAMFVEALSLQLAQHFGEKQVFIDRSRRLGTEDPKEREQERERRLATCDVLLVIIHPEWLDDLPKWLYDPRERANNLTDGKNDRVHHEISTALHRRLHHKDRPERRDDIIPVLLEMTESPKSVDLPEGIKELAHLQAFRLRFGSFTADLARLIEALEVHTITCWPPSPASNPKPQNSSPEISRNKVPGYAASRGLIATAFAISFILFMPREQPEWASTTTLLAWSVGTIMGTLLGATAATIFRGPLYEIEHQAYSLPAVWLSTVRLGLVLMATVLFLALTASLSQTSFHPIIVLAGLLGNLILSFSIYAATIRGLQEDTEWPPRFSARPMELCRTIVRLQGHLNSSLSGHSQPSRTQREQISSIIHQLDSAVTTLCGLENRARSRRNWLRDRPRLTAVYAAWLAANLGLTVTTMHESPTQVDSLNWYLWVAIGIAACGFGIGTMELIFHNDHKAWSPFLEKIKKDIEILKKTETNIKNRLQWHTPTYQKERS